MDPFAQLKMNQRQGWAHFAPVETMTAQVAPKLIRFARVQPGQRVLDVGCGTGVATIAAALAGARATGVDLTPELLVRARENAALAEVEIDFHEGDVEELKFPDGAFDVVLSEFGHMFAPRPDVAVREMLRVLKPGGTVAFTTWPPELFIGTMFALVGRYLPPPPPGVAPPPLWGEPRVVRERLGDGVKSVSFDREVLRNVGLSPKHLRHAMESTAGPMVKLVQSLAAEPARLAQFRGELEALIVEYLDGSAIRQDYLITRAVKA